MFIDNNDDDADDDDDMKLELMCPFVVSQQAGLQTMIMTTMKIMMVMTMR